MSRCNNRCGSHRRDGKDDVLSIPADLVSDTPVVAIVGPTAVGKSAVALRLAMQAETERGWGTTTFTTAHPSLRGAEIINCDAQQVYRGMSIGTAKASVDERAAVRHHLIDLVDIGHALTVADFRDNARAVIAEVLARGRVPLLVGGSGLYLSAVLDDLRFPPTDPAVRKKWNDELAEVGPAALHAELQRLSPGVAGEIDPRNGRRIVRALEALELTGTFAPRLPHELAEVLPAVRIGFTAPTQWLDRRIDRRVDRMFEVGFVDEVRGLLDVGLREAPTARGAVGYTDVIELIDGSIDEAECRRRVAMRTRRLARRQLRWFRRDTRIRWIAAVAEDADPDEPLDVDRATARVCEVVAGDVA